jgi:hypothetical protein
MLLLSDLLDPQHISFLQHPSSQTHTPQQNVVSLLVDDPFSLNFEKALAERELT